MILIVKRDDLPKKHRHRSVEGLTLDHAGLSPQLVEQAELIVFVEGVVVKFLKHREDIQSINSMNVLIDYISSTAPATKEHTPFSLKRFGQRRNKL
jgi:hypothetical protein